MTADRFVALCFVVDRYVMDLSVADCFVDRFVRGRFVMADCFVGYPFYNLFPENQYSFCETIGEIFTLAI